ncbi:MAG: hypothetical protein ACK559_33125, partial [bacterium]
APNTDSEQKHKRAKPDQTSAPSTSPAPPASDQHKAPPPNKEAHPPTRHSSRPHKTPDRGFLLDFS